MSGDGGLGYWHIDTRYYSSEHHKEDEISDENSLEVSKFDGRCGHRSLDTNHYSSNNRGGYHNSDNVRGGSM